MYGNEDLGNDRIKFRCYKPCGSRVIYEYGGWHETSGDAVRWWGFGRRRFFCGHPDDPQELIGYIVIGFPPLFNNLGQIN
jgi:hypothetical protein